MIKIGTLCYVVDTCLAGGTLSYRSKELVLLRDGKPEDVWMDLYYSPVPDDRGEPGETRGEQEGYHPRPSRLTRRAVRATSWASRSKKASASGRGSQLSNGRRWWGSMSWRRWPPSA